MWSVGIRKQVVRGTERSDRWGLGNRWLGDGETSWSAAEGGYVGIRIQNDDMHCKL